MRKERKERVIGTNNLYCIFENKEKKKYYGYESKLDLIRDSIKKKLVKSNQISTHRYNGNLQGYKNNTNYFENIFCSNINFK